MLRFTKTAAVNNKLGVWQLQILAQFLPPSFLIRNSSIYFCSSNSPKPLLKGTCANLLFWHAISLVKPRQQTKTTALRCRTMSNHLLCLTLFVTLRDDTLCGSQHELLTGGKLKKNRDQSLKCIYRDTLKQWPQGKMVSCLEVFEHLIVRIVPLCELPSVCILCSAKIDSGSLKVVIMIVSSVDVCSYTQSDVCTWYRNVF